MGGFSSLFGGGGGGGFSGGGIGSSANTTESTTDNKNNATSGENSAIFDTRGGNLEFNTLDGGVLDFAGSFGGQAFDFASKVNSDAIRNLSTGTAAVLDKITLDSGQRVQEVTGLIGKYALYAGVIAAAVLLYKISKG